LHAVAQDKTTAELQTWLFGEAQAHLTANWNVQGKAWEGILKDALHTGLDYAGREGTPVYCVSDGTVIKVAPGARGHRLEDLSTVAVYSKHADTTFIYLHMNDIAVELNEIVIAGQPMGKIGQRGPATGPHLHFEARPGKQFLAALDVGKTVDPYEATKTARGTLPDATILAEDANDQANNGPLTGKLVFVESSRIESRVKDNSLVVSRLDGSGSRIIYTSRVDTRTEESRTKLNERVCPIIDSESSPQWFPDGRRIAFLGRLTARGDSGGDFTLVVRADRQSPRFEDVRVHIPMKLETDRTKWKRDDKRTLHPYYDIGAGWDVWMMEEDGTGVQQLTQFENCTYFGRTSFKLSPDGKQIAFVRRKNLYSEVWGPFGICLQHESTLPPLCVMEIATRRVTVLSTAKRPFVQNENAEDPTRTYLYDFDFCWSPDGEKIAFSPKGNGNVWVMNKNGSNVHAITQFRPTGKGGSGEMATLEGLIWWPNGRSITFKGKGGVWMVNDDGSDLRRVPESGRYYGISRWFSPDGTRMVFFGHYGGVFNIYWREVHNPQMRLLCRAPSQVYSLDLFLGGQTGDGRGVLGEALPPRRISRPTVQSPVPEAVQDAPPPQVAPKRPSLDKIPRGCSEQDVISLLGQPKGRAGTRRRSILFYDQGTIVVENGKVSSVDMAK